MTQTTFISRKRHDAILEANPEFLRHLMKFYNPRWTLAGVTFYGLSPTLKASLESA